MFSMFGVLQFTFYIMANKAISVEEKSTNMCYLLFRSYYLFKIMQEYAYCIVDNFAASTHARFRDGTNEQGNTKKKISRKMHA